MQSIDKIMSSYSNDAVKTSCGLATMIFTVYWLIGKGNDVAKMSLMTMFFSSVVSTFGFLIVAMKVYSTSSVKGVSLKMMECYVIVFVARMFTTLSSCDGREVFVRDMNVGFWYIEKLADIMGLCLACTMVYFCRIRYKATYNPETDTLNHAWLIGTAFVMSLLFHSTLNAMICARKSSIAWFSDIPDAFAEYLEALAVLCQFFMFMKENIVQVHTAHFLAAQAVTRVLTLVSMYTWFGDLLQIAAEETHYDPQGMWYHPGRVYVGKWMMLMQLVSVLVMGDFIYQYLRCISQGISVENVRRPSCGC